MSEVISEYFDALERLKSGKTIRLPKGTKINNDSVALEAGRKKGAIKSSRLIFNELIIAIESASNAHDIAIVEGLKVKFLRNELKVLRKELENALARELSLIYELYELKKELTNLRSGKVIPIRINKVLD